MRGRGGTGVTIDHPCRNAEAGVRGPDERVELIEGEVAEMPPMASRDAAALERLTAILSAAVGGRAIVRQRLPVRLTDDSAPEPDIAVVRFRDDRYRSAHPSAEDVLLLVEVSGITMRHDLEVKVPLYARCGIREVRIVDLPGARVHFYGLPVNGRYRHVSATAQPMLTALGALSRTVVDLSERLER